MDGLEILVVEDDLDIRESMRALLEAEGYRVREAANGKEALDLLGATPDKPHLILLDLMMPVLNGWQFLERLQADRPDLFAAVPVVLITAAADIAQGAKKQVAGFVRKPFEVDSLLKTVRRLTETAQP